jgi:hypothetical protein
VLHIHRQPECRVKFGLLQHRFKPCTPDLCLSGGGEKDDELGIWLGSQFGGEEGGQGGELSLAGDQGEGLGDGLVRGDVGIGDDGDVLVGQAEGRSCHLHEQVSHRTKFKSSTMAMTDLADGIVHCGGELQSLSICIYASYDHPMFSHIGWQTWGVFSCPEEQR